MKGYGQQIPKGRAYDSNAIFRPRKLDDRLPAVKTSGVRSLSQILVRVRAYEGWVGVVDPNIVRIDDVLKDFLHRGYVVVCFKEGGEAVRGLGAVFSIVDDHLEVRQSVGNDGLELPGPGIRLASAAEEDLVITTVDRVLGLRYTEEAGKHDR